MKISILMAAYNGEKYIYNQLKSISLQTRKPDEIIICDDCSKDGTLDVIRKFQSDNPNLKIIVTVNNQNIGYAANFIKAFTLSTGELLFFSDQDDVWLPKKIEEMSRQFDNNNDIGGLVCDFELIDGDNKIIGKQKRHTKKALISKVSFNEMVHSFRCGGLNFAVRRDFVDRYKSFILMNELSHDVPLGIIISSQGMLYKTNQIYVQHRVHSNNATKPVYDIFERLGDVEKQIKASRNKMKWLEKCEEVVKDNLSAKELENYKHAICYYKKSLYALENRNINMLIKLCFLNNPMIDNKISLFNVITLIINKKER